MTGISLPPATTPSLYAEAKIDALCQSHFCDIRDATALAELVQAARPEIVFHLAAQPLVRASYRDPCATFETNVMGTAHVLDALRGLDSARVAVMVTTDKVYRDTNRRGPIVKTMRSAVRTPTAPARRPAKSSSPATGALSWPRRALQWPSARAGNVIGGGDWSEDRLIPDAVRAWQAGQALQVRRPQAVRPWQHVLDPLAGYLTWRSICGSGRRWRAPIILAPTPARP